MVGSNLQSVARSLLLALATLLGLSSAQAGVWSGSWDPTYGSPFTNLGWRGSANFDIPASPPCATDGTACLTGSPFIKDGQVTFYDVNTNTNLAVINWSTAELSGTGISALRFQAGNVTQFATDPFPLKSPTLLPGANGSSYGNFDLQQFSLAFVIDFDYDPSAAVALYSGPLLPWRGTGCSVEFCPGGLNDLSVPENRPQLRVTLVPEPGSVALLCAALIALGGTARRRRYN